jgi:energy-coupling factor transporter ATP-binding protein EcfA2
MTHEQKLNLVDALEAYMVDHNFSQSDVSDATGVNAGYLINIRRKDFTFRSGEATVQLQDKYFYRIADFIDYETEKVFWPTRQTKQLEEMWVKVKEAKENAETAVLIGETGCGKSYTIGLFKKKYPKDVFVVTVSNSDNQSDLLDKVLKALKIKTESRSKSVRLDLIAQRLKSLSEKGHEPVLVFDESEYMKQPALCVMKEMNDGLKNWASLVLLGTDELIDNLEALKKRKKPGIKQFCRRIKFRTLLLPAIDRKFSDFFTGIDPDLKRWLQRRCDNYGELHDVLVPAMREADRTGSELTLEFVQAVLGLREYSAVA